MSIEDRMTEYTVDPVRLDQVTDGEIIGSGFFVRAKLSGHFVSVDIVALDKKSLLAWLKSRCGDNPYAEDVVGHLLGHGPLHDPAPG